LKNRHSLEYQRQLNSRKGRDNTQTLFGVVKIPTDAQIRNILDKINPNVLFEVFIVVYQRLKSKGLLKQHEVLGGQLLIPYLWNRVLFLKMYSL
jgi:hypothetical protein